MSGGGVVNPLTALFVLGVIAVFFAVWFTFSERKTFARSASSEGCRILSGGAERGAVSVPPALPLGNGDVVTAGTAPPSQ